MYCPGEDACSTTPTFPMCENEIDYSSPQVEAVCKECAMFPTKPGTENPVLTPWIGRAVELDGKRNSGASFDMDSLSIWDWVAVEALMDAREQGQLKEARRQEKERDRERRGANILAKVGRSK